jgi:hypothetical protein
VTSAAGEPAERRFFVTVHAADEASLRRLSEHDLDLFSSTARRTDDGPVIEGLVTLAAVQALVDAGYQVTVVASMESRSRAHEVSTFEDWLAERSG